MERVGPLELLEHLAFYVSRDYNLVRLRECIYNETEDKLTAKFIYHPDIAKVFEGLKTRLETDFDETINRNFSQKIDISFEYDPAYMDAETLMLSVKRFLSTSFGILTVDLEDEDIQIVQTGDDFTVNIYLEKQVAAYVKSSDALKKYLAKVEQNHFATFSFFFNEKKTSKEKPSEKMLDYISGVVKAQTRVDKSMKVENITYYLGKPVKNRPTKVQFLRVSDDEQTIAGTIKNLTRREYTKKDTNQKAPYFTFNLDDGSDTASCVFFPREKTLEKFEELIDEEQVIVIGRNSMRNGRVSFTVSGISKCTLVNNS